MPGADGLTWISVICACVPLVAGCCFFFFPDTPAWYMQHGRKDEARASLLKFRGHDYPAEKLDAELDEIYNEIKQVGGSRSGCKPRVAPGPVVALIVVPWVLLQAQDSKKSTMEAFSTGEAKLGLGLSMNLMMVQQLSGVSAVIFYAGDIFAVRSTVQAFGPTPTRPALSLTPLVLLCHRPRARR